MKHLPKVADGPSLKNEEVRECFTGNAPEFHLKPRSVTADAQEGHSAETGRHEVTCMDESHRWIWPEQEKAVKLKRRLSAGNLTMWDAGNAQWF